MPIFQKTKDQGNRGDVRKIYVTRHFLETSGPRGHFFEKKPAFRYGLEECVYQISGLYLFSLYPKDPVQTNVFTSENRNILEWLLAH